MANNKDFILKNAVEVGGPTNVTLGTITSISPFNFLNISYENKSLDVSSKESNLGGGDISVDGTKFYVVGGVSDSVHQYNLSTAFDLSTASFTASFAFSQDGFCKDVKFKSDGTKMYLLGADNNTIYQFSLSTAWAVSTASYDSVSFSHSSQSTVEQGLFFKPDGTKFYMVDSNGNIYQYSMSTSWNLSTASYDSVSYTSLGNATGITFNSEGNTFLLAIGDSTDYIKEYTLSTAWNISTASPTVSTFNLGAQTNDPSNIVLSNNDTSLYIISSTSHQYSSSLDQEQINLDTGNYFKDTPSGTSTYSISNAGDVQSFQLEVTGGLEAVAQNFSTDLYTGNASTQTITNGIDIAGDGGLVWVKGRSGTAGDSAWGGDIAHNLFDSSAPQKPMNSAKSDARTNFGAAGVNFTSTGFTVGYNGFNDLNYSTFPYVSWSFRKAPKFFDVVTYTGNGVAGRVIPHSLNSAVGTVIIKQTNASRDWAVWHRSGGTNPGGKLNSTAAFGYTWVSSTSTTSITLENEGIEINGNGQSYVAYLFAHDTASDSQIKCGSYTGGGSTDVEINLGWQPQWLLIRRSDAVEDWFLVDSERGFGIDGTDTAKLKANSSEAETTSTSLVATTPTGFKTTDDNAGFNSSGGNYIYIAIRAASDPDITWPTSIEFAGGLAPAAPATGETDVFTFSTDDGGTSYIGTKTADNLS